MTKLERKIITAIGNILRNEAEDCDAGEVYFAGLIADALEREGFQSAMEKAQDGIDRINERRADRMAEIRSVNEYHRAAEGKSL
jgi:hypothetical protein